MANHENSIKGKLSERIERRFPRAGRLTGVKLLEYIPAMLLTNLSVLMLTSVDGIVVGNLVSSDALSSVNIIQPAITFIGTMSALIASGASTCLATRMGKNDQEGVQRAKAALWRVVAVAALAVAVLQIPVMHGMIASYGLSPEMQDLARQYAIGIMISMPFGLVSTVGVYQLQILGKMRPLAILSVVEGVANLVFDLFFIIVLDMGVVGAGLGTACANVIRSVSTVIYLARKTDAFRTGGAKACGADVREILSCGMPDAANSVMLSVRNYLIMFIVVHAFGDVGGVIKGVCAFSLSLVNVFVGSTRDSMRPLAGLLSGAEDHKGLTVLLRQCILLGVILSGIIVVIAELAPELIYTIHGVDEIPDGGLLSLRLMVLCAPAVAATTMLRMYLINRKDAAFCTKLAFVGNIMLPIFAFMLWQLAPAPFMWLAYLFSELVFLFAYLRRYASWCAKDKERDASIIGTLSLEATYGEGFDVFEQVKLFADANGVSPDVANRLTRCVQIAAEQVDDVGESAEDIVFCAEITFHEDGVRLFMLDNDKGLFDDVDEERRASNAAYLERLKGVAKSVEYQYILNMNYSLVEL